MQTVKITSFSLWFMSLIVFLISFKELPAQVPIRFDFFEGSPIRWATKNLLFLLSLLHLVVILIMSFVPKKSIHEQKMVQISMLLISTLFSDLMLESIKIAKGESEKLSFFSNIIVVILFVTIAFYTYKNYKKAKA